MHDNTLAQLAEALRRRSLSSSELTQHFLDRIARHDTTLNSFITVTADMRLRKLRLPTNESPQARRRR
jgi:aspartyl-tRNA(Asn)/glutamyl-tRNA(Gln) amidotransferase subunit A